MSRNFLPYLPVSYSGSRCSLLVWCLVGFLLMLHLYTSFRDTDVQNEENQMRISHRLQLRELEEVEEENIQIPAPRGRRSPRAAKRRPRKVHTSLIDEFLDESSQLRRIFFPDETMAIDPVKDTGNDTFYYYPGRIWLDTEGNPIQAHGGGILYDEKTETYYWYGEFKDGPTYHAHKNGAARKKLVNWRCTFETTLMSTYGQSRRSWIRKKFSKEYGFYSFSSSKMLRRWEVWRILAF